MTTARIDARFAALKAEGRAGFIPYVMTGDPSRDEALEILRGLPAAGADLIELGLAFSDPMAEGPPIQRAALRGLAAGMTLRGKMCIRDSLPYEAELNAAFKRVKPVLDKGGYKIFEAVK